MFLELLWTVLGKIVFFQAGGTVYNEVLGQNNIVIFCSSGCFSGIRKR